MVSGGVAAADVAAGVVAVVVAFWGVAAGADAVVVVAVLTVEAAIFWLKL